MIMDRKFRLLFFFFQLYGLWKDPEGLRIIATTGASLKTSGEENKETINQLSQEVQRLKQELRRVSVSLSQKQRANNMILHCNYCTDQYNCFYRRAVWPQWVSCKT